MVTHYRITYSPVNIGPIVGRWVEYNIAKLLKQCEAFAEDGVSFTVEFKTN